VFGSNVVLASAFSLLMSEAKNTPCALCKSFHTSHSFSPNSCWGFYQKAGALRVGKRLEFPYEFGHWFVFSAF
jgi:hypothetical protein